MTTNHCPIQKFLSCTPCKQSSANTCSHCCILLLRYLLYRCDDVEAFLKDVRQLLDVIFHAIDITLSPMKP